MDNKLTEYVLRHSKKHDEELKYDFMPSLLEIIERPAHKAGTVIITGIFSLLVAAVIWACLSETDVVITSSGTIQPVGNINVVKSYSGGFVQSIDVAEGDHVSAGDTIIELNTDSLEIDEEQLITNKKILETQLEIYRKINRGEDISEIKPSSYVAFLKPYVQTILDSDAVYKNSVSNLEKEKAAADINLQIGKLQLEEFRSSGTERQVKMQELNNQQCTLSIEQLEMSINDAKTQYNAQINVKLSEISSQIADIDSSLEKCTLSKGHQNITAPVDGYVNNILVNTPGETVTAAQQIAYIVPENTPLEMVCYIKNMDIADVRTGMNAEIKLEAYQYSKYGTVKGKVKYISSSSMNTEQLGNAFMVKLELDDSDTDIDIRSGLSGVVEIKTGKRTVMDYFLEPITKGFGESLKEK